MVVIHGLFDLLEVSLVGTLSAMRVSKLVLIQFQRVSTGVLSEYLLIKVRLKFKASIFILFMSTCFHNWIRRLGSFLRLGFRLVSMIKASWSPRPGINDCLVIKAGIFVKNKS